LILERYFVENISQNSKMERKMYGPALFFEIIKKSKNKSKNMAKNAVFTKKFNTQKVIFA